MAGEHLALLVEGDHDIGVTRRLEERSPLVGPAFGVGGRGALEDLMPGDRRNAERLAGRLQPIAVFLKQGALRPDFQAADGRNDEAHGASPALRLSFAAGGALKASARWDRLAAPPTTSSRGCRIRAPRGGTRAR